MSRSRLSKEQISRLSKVLGHDFGQQPELLVRALTHRSFNRDNYERLEFLGDSILNFIIAEAICDRFPNADEGTLTRLRANLVRSETLAGIGRELGLGEYLILGKGALTGGGHERDSVLDDVVEALIGAIYRDGGFDAAKRFVTDIFADRIAALDPTVNFKDPKTRLQELLQKQGRPLPDYNILDITGPPHRQVFHVECILKDPAGVFTGQGSSRRKAEQDAAGLALDALASH